MTTPEIDPQHHFDIHASVVLQLGENLITDVAQALVELVKNSYDADASYARIIVDTQAKPGEGTHYKDAIGYISVEDDGIGMDEEAINRGWLTVSNSPKREMKKKGLTTERGRTPLGDKGLGRLCAQRLASNIEIFTKPKGSPIGYHVAFSWDSFLEENILLSEVPVIFNIIDPKDIKGTKIIISGLKDRESWNSATDNLRVRLSQLISPYEEVRDFRIAAVVNGQKLDLYEYSNDLRRAAIVNYNFVFDEKEFRVKGKAKLNFFRPNPRDEEETKEDYRSFIQVDGGENFFDFLVAKKQADQFRLKRSSEKNWFIEYEFSTSLIGVDKVKKQIDGTLANPGQFHGEIDSFNLEGTNLLGLGKEAIQNFIREMGGIRIYRNGFGIRIDSDILELRNQQTSAKSYYGLRPANITGFIALSAEHNAKLEELTNREGFQDTPYYENFHLLLRALSKFTLDVQTFLRRGRTEFFKICRESLIQSQHEETPEELTSDIQKQISSGGFYSESLKKTRETLESVNKEAEQIAKFADEMSPSDHVQNKPFVIATQSVTRKIEQARIQVTHVEHELPELERKFELLSNQLVILKRQIAQLGEQINQTYETVSLGLTAEALSHEITTIIDNLAYRNRQVIDYLIKQNMKDMVLNSYTQYINSTVGALRKQLSHLEPSLRYVRESREEITLDKYFKEVEAYYKDRFANQNIEIQIKCDVKSENFTILMNKGKLNQVIDNLLLNSEYWLREDLRLKLLARGIISIEISKPFVRISDNSRGIDPSVEKSLFEPFVTTKGQGRGRGLGLFIVEQLLGSENCSIAVLSDRNKHNRLYIFEIDLSGGLSGKR